MALQPARLRKRVLEIAHSGQTVHVPCAFSLIEILSVVYGKFFKSPKNRPDDPERDILALSKGHGVMALYACLEDMGWISKADMDRYHKDGSPLRGLSEENVPGVDVTSGSMGHGLPIAAGMAFGLKRRGSARRVFCVAGDGEMNEGSMWEALAFIGHHKLDNLTLIVDVNQFQAMGRTKDILDLEPWKDKLEAFGFETLECDGHDPKALEAALSKLLKKKGKPQALVARTVKGKGVSFMEAENKWHYTRLNDEMLKKALAELAA